MGRVGSLCQHPPSALGSMFHSVSRRAGAVRPGTAPQSLPVSSISGSPVGPTLRSIPAHFKPPLPPLSGVCSSLTASPSFALHVSQQPWEAFVCIFVFLRQLHSGWPATQAPTTPACQVRGFRACAIPKLRRPLLALSCVLVLSLLHHNKAYTPSCAAASWLPTLCSQLAASQTWLGLPPQASTRVASSRAGVYPPGCPLGSSLEHQLPGLYHACLRSKACTGRDASALLSPTHGHRLTPTQH